MLKGQLDLERLRYDIRTLIADCIFLKKELRAPWTRPMAEAQRRHERVRRRLTDLFVLLAASRGRLHVVAPPRDARAGEPWSAAEHAVRVSARVAPDYAQSQHAATGAP